MAKSKPIVYNPPLLKIISPLSIIYLIYYLWWRATSTINPEFPFFSWVLWSAEAFGVISYMLFSYFTRDVSPSTSHVSPKKGKKVDIFVPTYNEAEYIIEATLVGCKNISYPHTTYVLDDGNRENVKKLAERFNCKYIARPTHEHAKAGNINYALENSNGEFIAVFDTDMVPQPDYLERTLGYFEDENLALVQLPQEFYNLDSIQHAVNDGISWHEQSLFFRVIQPGKNYSNSAFWCGTPSVVRRKALIEVGGVATETITEDIHTSVRLHSKGWNTLFINETLAFGIAPQTIKSFLLQRLRWAQGTMQLYRSKDSPFTIKGLSIEQRAAYASSFMAYFEAFQKLILMSVPILILGFNILPMSVEMGPLLLRWIPYFLLNFFANQLGGRGVFNFFKTEKYNLLKTVIFIQSTILLISKKPMKFKVTPKTVEDSVYAQERLSMSWYMVFVVLISGVIFNSVLNISLSSTQIRTDLYYIAIGWAGYNAFVIAMALREILTKRHERKQYRFPAKAEAKIYNSESKNTITKSQLVDISLSGAGLEIDEDISQNVENLVLEINPRNFERITIPIKKLVSIRKRANGKTLVGLIFPENLGPDNDLLYKYIFVHLPNLEGNTVFKVNEFDPFKSIINKFKKANQ